MDKTSLYQDGSFRKIVVGSTGLALASMLGSMISLRIGQNVGLQFAWHWSVVAVAAAVLLWNWRFWNVLWELQESPGKDIKRKLAVHLGILLLLGVGCFLYPIRFVEQSYGNGILRGLVTAAGALCAMFWLIYKCGQGFAKIDAVELERQAKSDQ